MVSLKKINLKDTDSYKKNSKIRKKYSIFLKSWVILGLLILVTAVYFFYFSKTFNIKKIIVNGHASCVNQNDITKDPKTLNQTLLLFNQGSYKVSFYKKYPCTTGLEIKKKFPNQIELTFVPKSPVGMIGVLNKSNLKNMNLDLKESTPSSQAASISTLDFDVDNLSVSGYFFTDTDGNLYEQTTIDQANNLPIFYSLRNDDSTRNIEKDFLYKILQIIDKLKSLEINPSVYKQDGSKLLVNSQPKIVFVLNKDIFRQIASLQVILQKAKMNLRSLPKGKVHRIIDTVDLRFDKPIVVYSESK